MKTNKLLSTLALFGTLFGGTLIGSSQAATTVSGTIDPILIGPVFSLTLVSVDTTPNDPGTPGNEFAQNFSTTAGNLYFGTVNMLPAGIFANNPTNGTYGDVAHRAGAHYTETRLYMDNNSNNNFSVTLTVAGDLISLTPPTNTFAEGTSVMHVNSAALVAADIAGAVTAFSGNIQNIDTSKAVPNGTAIELYKTTALASPISDAFKALVFLDYLPTSIPFGTYGGTTTWTIASI
jgi:hypothetical protein